MKKYIIRLIAAVPMLGSGIATIIFFILAFEENNALILVSISSMFSFVVCATYYEHIVIDICEFVRTICDETWNYSNLVGH